MHQNKHSDGKYRLEHCFLATIQTDEVAGKPYEVTWFPNSNPVNHIPAKRREPSGTGKFQCPRSKYITPYEEGILGPVDR